jgi:hypothetical protein
MIHPILAVVAVGGLIYSLSPMCPPATRWPQRLCYGAMLYLAWWCPWPGWAIFLACDFRMNQRDVLADRRGDASHSLRRRHTRPRAIADLPGCKDEESLKANVVAHIGLCSDDASVIISVALQHGVPAAAPAKSISRAPDAMGRISAASAIGAGLRSAR